MSINKKINITILIFAFVILFFNVQSYAGTQSWNSLDFDVQINSDGSMSVVETWDVYVSETNTLFKDFELDSSKFSGIDNVKVTKVENGTERSLTQIYEEQYHVDSGCYYGLKIDSSTFEIAWNVGLDNSSGNRTYKIYYTVEDAIKIYNDCTELYWMFLSPDNKMAGRNITGKIKLPRKVDDIEKLRIWAHGDLTGEISKISSDTITFNLPMLYADSMLEVRVVTEENIYDYCYNKYRFDRLEDILSEEQRWADEANRAREEATKVTERLSFLVWIIIGANVVGFIYCIVKSNQYSSLGKELKAKYSYPKSDLKYFRDIPDEKNATPARAAYLCDFRKNNSNVTSNISRIFAATILDLSLKGIIEFEPVDEKNVKIVKTKKFANGDEGLTSDEKIVFMVLRGCMIGKESITTKELSKIASKEYDFVYGQLNKLERTVEKDHIKLKNVSEQRQKLSKKWNDKFIVYFVISIFAICFMFPIGIGIGLAFMAHTCRKNAVNISKLTEKGNEESNQWKALEKYMEEYSMLDEKLVPDIVLWEKYLVYATAFGISKHVIKQLKVVHPEMFETDMSNSMSNYGYWHIMTNSNYGIDCFDNFNNSLSRVYSNAQSAYNIAHSSSSSGSGGGGGFSGGGGGRRWRW